VSKAWRGVCWTATGGDDGGRLDKFLSAPERLGSRGRARAAIERGKVFVNDCEAGPSDAAGRLAEGDRVRVWEDRPGSARPPARARRSGDLEIVFEDAFLLVLNKPPGLLVVPLERKGDVPTVQGQVQQHLRSRGKRRPLVVHRIDRDTSGLVMFAKDERTQHLLKGQFERRTAGRVYQAVVHGHLDPPSGTWRDHLVWDQRALVQKGSHDGNPRAKEAVCHYRVLERFEASSLIEVTLVSGRRNQIRLQAKLHGHPLVGEQRYVGSGAPGGVDFLRQALHAWRLAFDHPADGSRLELEAPLPADFGSLIRRLGGKRRA
jgi:23S rRNA pseudouridine1911/1915/1917 synthase